MTGEGSEGALEGDATLAAEVANTPSMLYAIAGAPPRSIGRFTIIRELGAGSMGTVYMAYDDELDRRVAIKVIHTGRGRGKEGAKEKAKEKAALMEARVRREAMALARLSHPNVVQIYEVGEAPTVGENGEQLSEQSQIYLAMEYVEGVTLKAWLQAQEHDWRSAISLISQAGHGLAAAHRAGLIHRDFKPDNVIVGDDGRVRVLDFGLARPHVHDDEALDVGEARAPTTIPSQEGVGGVAERLRESPRYSDSGTSLTRTGTLIGTPRYMSPEQLYRQTADARSDIFSFSLVLYEALYGQYPFPARDVRGIILRVSSGEVEPPPRDTPVPTWVHRVLLRGLQIEPADRFASMDEFLLALRRDPTQARRQAVATALTIAALGGAALAWNLETPPLAPCSDVRSALVGVWDEGRGEALRGAFTSTDAPYAQAAYERAGAALDDYAERWGTLRQEVCEAHAGGLSSDTRFDRQIACLGRRLAGVDALAGVLIDGGGQAISHADEMVAALPPLGPCVDAEPHTGDLAPPEDPQQAADVEAIRSSLERVRTLDLAGQYTTAANDAMVLLSAAESSGYEPVIAEVRYWNGLLQGRVGDIEQAEATLSQTLARSFALGHEELAADTSLAILSVIDEAGRYDEALRWAPYAEALLERVGASEEQGTALQVTIAKIELHHGDYQAATDRLGRTLAKTTAEISPDHPDVVPIYAALAKVHQERHELDLALPLLERALGILEDNLGPEHPRCATILDDLGGVLGMQGRYPEAELQLRRALALRERALGPDHLLVGETLNNLGLVLSNLKRDDLAEETFLRAISVIEGAAGAEHPSLGYPLNGLAVMRLGQDRCAEAIPLLERALEINRLTLQPDHKALAFPILNIAACNAMLERHEEAAEGYSRGLELLVPITGENTESVARIHRDLGGELLALGRFSAAVGELARSLAIFESLADERLVDDRAEAAFLLARALVGDRPRDPEVRRRARELAATALEALDPATEEGAAGVEEVRAWLRKNRG